MFDKIVSHVPAPSADPDGPFKFLVTLLDRDNFLGRILTGLVYSGSVKTNQPIHALDADGNVVETGRASKLMTFRGLERVPTEEANAGDIISLAGLTVATVANTIADPSVTEPLHAQEGVEEQHADRAEGEHRAQVTAPGLVGLRVDAACAVDDALECQVAGAGDDPVDVVAERLVDQRQCGDQRQQEDSGGANAEPSELPGKRPDNSAAFSPTSGAKAAT